MRKAHWIRRRLVDLEDYVNSAIDREFEIDRLTQEITASKEALIIDRDEARTVLVNMKWERDGNCYRATVTEAEMDMIEAISNKHYKIGS